MPIKYMHKGWLLVMTFLVISACSTQKKKGEVTKLQKFYQNTTSEFNGYFNANILYEESVAKLNEQTQDNYNKLLPVYKYTEASNPKEVAEDLDNAIKKVSVVVSLHRQSDWVDDCYLLMGKSMFMKQDYESAQEALEYMVAEFNPEALAKKKFRKKKKAEKKAGRSAKGKKKKKKEVEKKKKSRKKEVAKKKKARKKEVQARKKARSKGKKVPSKPKMSNEEKAKLAREEAAKKAAEEEAAAKAEKEAEEKALAEAQKPKTNYILKHRPCYQEGVLWLAKTYVERDNYLRAEFLFNELLEDPYTFKDVKKELYPAVAYFYLEQKKYDEAVMPLTEAIELVDDRNERARYAFILAQIHQNAGRNQEALANFAAAKKYSNNYEMEFSAELNVLKNSWATGTKSEDQVLNDLEKMLKEDKNFDYKDQIYFVLADIALKAGNKPKAIEYLAQSLEFNSVNQAQKGESHLLLADLYYEDEQYVNAKTNYDAAMTAISKADERYSEVERRSKGLTDIVKNIEIITLQDSLLRVSEMSDGDKRKLAAEIKRKEAEAKLAAAKASSNPAGGSKFPRANAPVGGAGVGNVKSSFFAYNEKAAKKGRREFDRRWPGRTTLEDDWRRSNRQTISIDESIADVSAYEEALTDEEVKKILGGIPNTDAAKQKANDQIMAALFELGTLYRDRLKNNPKSVATLEELNQRYPGNRHELESWYFLYLAHSDLGNTSKKREYFDKILEKYANTIYARVLKDPDYLSKTQDKESKINSYYNETYVMFTSGQYQQVQERVQKVSRLFGGNNSHQPRFALLDAMSTGALKKGGGKEAYVKKLKELIGKYPSTPEEKRAKEILRLLGDKSVIQSGLLDQEKMNKINSVFRVEEDKVHYGIVVFDEKVDLNKVKSNISDYNRKNHKLDRLRISNIYLGSDTNRPVIIVRKFKNKETAMKYYQGVVSDLKDFISIKAGYDLFVVNQYNYRQVLRQKSVDQYRLFFAENYLGE
ncbi:MAG: tetratricopeptide repeat protein [Bacteroidota bacterium]